MQSGKVQYLEGLRGIAAMQVVLLHFVSGFLPDTAEHAWPPLRVLFDGHSAVYLFFLISGAVLTPSFARSGAFLGKLFKRVVRLGVPVAAAAVIATALLALMPDAHRRAATLTGAGWLAMDSSGAPTLLHLAREIGLDSLLVGYREATLFGPLAQHLPPMDHSLDAPFWSLHLELYGSLLVLILVSLRARSIWLWRIAIAATVVAFGTHPMFLFVLGHLSVALLGRRPTDAGLRLRHSVSLSWPGVARSSISAHFPQWTEAVGGRAAPGYDRSTASGLNHLVLSPGDQRPAIGLTAFGGLLLVLGVALCATKDWHAVETLRLVLSRSELAAAPNLFQFQSQLGAVALYFGVLLCPAVWRVLECGVCRHLGRLSFGIYLLHFPILFTLVCGAFIGLHGRLPDVVAVATAFVLFLATTLAAAMVFERWIDRPAIALSRRAALARESVSGATG